MKKDKNYWLKRGSGYKQRDGFVCLGAGDSVTCLRDQIGYSGTFYDDDGEKGFSGDHPEVIVYMEENDFNSMFSISPKEEIEKLNIQIAKLQKEIEQKNLELRGIQIGDLVYCKKDAVHCVARVSEISAEGVRGRYFESGWMKVRGEYFFPFDSYKIAKIEL